MNFRKNKWIYFLPMALFVLAGCASAERGSRDIADDHHGGGQGFHEGHEGGGFPGGHEGHEGRVEPAPDNRFHPPVNHNGPMPLPEHRIPSYNHVRDHVIIHQGHSEYRHWEHPVFERPRYEYDWNRVQQMSCTAEDQNGEQFPITEDGYARNQWQSNIVQIEDAALDRCYNESTVGTTCVLVGCSPTYFRTESPSQRY